MLALVLGYPEAAAGAAAVIPVVALNRWITAGYVQRAKADDVRGIVLRAQVRTAIGIVALLLGSLFSVEAMLGVLMGLSVEVLTYLGEAVAVLLRRRGA